MLSKRLWRVDAMLIYNTINEARKAIEELGDGFYIKSKTIYTINKKVDNPPVWWVVKDKSGAILDWDSNRNKKNAFEESQNVANENDCKSIEFYDKDPFKNEKLLPFYIINK